MVPETLQDADRFAWLDEPVRHWASEAPGRAAVSDPAGTWTFADFDAIVDGIAVCLARRDVAAGDRVAIVLENCAGAAAAILAAIRCRAWAVPINARLAATEIDRILEHCTPRVSLFTTGISAEAGAHGERFRAAADPGSGTAGLAFAVTHPQSVREPFDPAPDQHICALLYTSGTTGAPKGVMLTRDNLSFIAARGAQVRGISPDDRVYSVLPLSHAFGLSSVFLAALHHGAQVAFAPRFDAEAVARALADEGITVLQGAPAMFARLLTLAERKGNRLPAPALRYLSAGGAPLDSVLKRRVEALWGVPLANGYGITETSPTVSVTRPDDPVDDDSTGPPLPGVAVRIAGLDGIVLPEGAIGEIEVRGRSLMKGYYRSPEATAAALTQDGWFRTGDLGRLDARGHLYVVGRLKELIIRSGFNVHPPEVEAALAAHPDVEVAAVLGRKVAGNEEVVAFVQPVAGRQLDVAALHAFAAGRLAPYKRPAEYIVMAELPATGSGKVLKARLRMLLQAAPS